MQECIFSSSIPGVFAEEVIRTQKFSMVTRHFHESFELYFLLDGQRFYFIEQDIYRIQPHMAVLISQNQIHKTSSLGNQQHHRFLLQLDAPFFDPLLSALGYPSLKNIAQTHWGATTFSEESWNHCLSLIHSIQAELSSPCEDSIAVTRLLTLQLLLFFCQNRRKAEQSLWRESSHDHYKVKTGMYQTIHEIAQFLQNNSAQTQSLNALAEQFFLSRSTLIRSFKAVTGFTVNEYQTLARIKKAQFLLSETSLSVSQIAEQTGFGTTAYFVRCFKKITATTPLQYRKASRN